MSNNAALANDAWESLLRAHAAMVRRFQTEDNWEPLSMREYDVLYTLSKAGCSLSQRALLDGVLLSQPALSRLVDRLVDRGLLERSPDPADRRGIRIILTDEGRAVQREVGRRHARLITARMCAALTPDQMRELRVLTNAITEAHCDE